MDHYTEKFKGFIPTLRGWLPHPLTIDIMLTRYITWWGLLANLIWAITVLVNPVAMHATPLNTLAEFFNYSAKALSFSLFVSSIATFAALSTAAQPDLRTIALLIPQQFFMCMAAIGSVVAMVQGQYADGVDRSIAFIVADQFPWVLAAVLYTLSILEFYARPAKWRAFGLPSLPALFHLQR